MHEKIQIYLSGIFEKMVPIPSFAQDDFVLKLAILPWVIIVDKACP